MNRTRCHAFFTTLLLCTFLIAVFPHRALAADPLQGKWKVTVEPDEDARKTGGKTVEDTIVFTPNKFYSEAWKKHGFAEADFDEDVRSFGPATFTCQPTSDAEGKIKWTGTVTASEITGEMTWTKKDGTELHYTYKGSRVQ